MLPFFFFFLLLSLEENIRSTVIISLFLILWDKTQEDAIFLEELYVHIWLSS